MAGEPTIETHSLFIERDSDRKIRQRNKLHYRFNHWPIWIFVFFIAPGPLVFDLFERGFDQRMTIWLAAVLIGTAVAGLLGQLPGCEPRPYIIRFTEDRPNPVYRRVCYTTAWGEVIAFALLNIAGLAYAAVTGEWRLKQLYRVRILSARGHDVVPRRVRIASSRQTVNEGRRSRAPIFLRLGLGSCVCAACSVVSLESATRIAAH